MSWERRTMQNLKRTWLVNPKLMWGSWWLLTRAFKNIKNLSFNELLLTEVYIMFELKKYRGVMFDCTEDWCKIWRKTDLYFLKWHEEFGKFSPENVRKSKKLGLSLGPFIQSRKCMSLKFTKELCVMRTKNDAKFEEELTCQLKIDMRNLMIFHLSTWKSQKFEL